MKDSYITLGLFSVFFMAIGLLIAIIVKKHLLLLMLIGALIGYLIGLIVDYIVKART